MRKDPRSKKLLRSLLFCLLVVGWVSSSTVGVFSTDNDLNVSINGVNAIVAISTKTAAIDPDKEVNLVFTSTPEQYRFILLTPSPEFQIKDQRFTSWFKFKKGINVPIVITSRASFALKFTLGISEMPVSDEGKAAKLLEDNQFTNHPYSIPFNFADGKFAIGETQSKAGESNSNGNATSNSNDNLNLNNNSNINASSNSNTTPSNSNGNSNSDSPPPLNTWAKISGFLNDKKAAYVIPLVIISLVVVAFLIRQITKPQSTNGKLKAAQRLIREEADQVTGDPPTIPPPLPEPSHAQVIVTPDGDLSPKEEKLAKQVTNEMAGRTDNTSHKLHDAIEAENESTGTGGQDKEAPPSGVPGKSSGGTQLLVSEQSPAAMASGSSGHIGRAVERGTQGLTVNAADTKGTEDKADSGMVGQDAIATQDLPIDSEVQEVQEIEAEPDSSSEDGIVDGSSQDADHRVDNLYQTTVEGLSRDINSVRSQLDELLALVNEVKNIKPKTTRNSANLTQAASNQFGELFKKHLDEQQEVMVKELNSSVKSITNLIAVVNESTNSIYKKVQDVIKSVQQIDDRSKNQENVSDDLTTRISQVEETLHRQSAFSRRIEEIASAVERIDKQGREQEINALQLPSKIERLEASIGQLATGTNRIESVEQNVNKLTTNIRRLDDVDKDIDKLAGNINTLAEHINDISPVKKNVSDLAAGLKRLEAHPFEQMLEKLYLNKPDLQQQTNVLEQALVLAFQGVTPEVKIAEELLEQSTEITHILETIVRRLNGSGSDKPEAIASILSVVDKFKQFHSELKDWQFQRREGRVRLRFNIEVPTSENARRTVIDALTDGLNEQVKKLQDPGSYFQYRFDQLVTTSLIYVVDLCDKEIDLDRKKVELQELLAKLFKRSSLEGIAPEKNEDFRLDEQTVTSFIPGRSSQERSQTVAQLVSRGFRYKSNLIRKASVMLFR